MSVASACRFVLSLLGVMLPREHRQWAAAIRAEIDIPVTAREKIALTVSGIFGLLFLTARGTLLRWSCYSRTLAVVAAYGLAVGYADGVSASRWPLRILVVFGAVGFGIARPKVAAIAGVLMGLSIVCVARGAGSMGPYAHDPGDVWIPLLPAILLALVGSALGKKWERLRLDRSAEESLSPS